PENVYQVPENWVGTKLWQETIPNLKFQLPASDLCEVCETFKAKLLVAKSNKDEYDQIKVEYDQHCWTWNDFSLLFKDKFRNFPYITQYYHFRFNNSSNDIGKVYASTESGGTEISFQLLCNNNFNVSTILKTISIRPLTKERKYYLYTKIRQHVNDPYKDVYCANPEIKK
ncbi:26216_t:CDS:2, partial [Gigaspora rosea]